MLPRRLRVRLASAAMAALFSMPATNPAALADTFTWTGGNFIPDVTAPSPMTFPDILQINAGANKFFSGVSWTNQSTVIWNADSVFLMNGSTIDNQGRWEARSDNTLVNNGGAVPTFNSSGHFLKSGGAGSTTIGTMSFINSGMIEAQAGTINFSGGNATFNAGSQFIGAGSILVSSNAAFNGAFTSSNLTLSAGTFSATSAVINGTVNFSGGAMAGDWQIASGQTLQGNTGTNKFLVSAALTNNGTLRWNTSNSMFLQNGSSLTNNSLHEVLGASALANNGGAISTYANNATGTLRVAAGGSLNVGTIAFVNNAGRLQADGTMTFGGGNVAFNDGTFFTGGGANLITSAASFSGSIRSDNLVLQSGTYTGSSVSLLGSTELSGGTITGGWELPALQALNGKTGVNKFFSAAAFTNKGTVQWQTANSLFLMNGATFDNQGSFKMQSSAPLVNNGGPLSTFTNSGSFSVSAGEAVNVGTIAFINNAGTLAVDGTMTFGGGNAIFNANTTFGGSGVAAITNNAAFNGPFSSSNVSLRSGTFFGTSAVSSGVMEWLGGTITGGWDSGNASWTAMGNSNKFLSDAAFTNHSTVNWQTPASLFLMNGSTFSNHGLFQFLAGADLVNNGGALSTFDNRDTLRVAAGQSAAVRAIAFVNNGGTIDVGAGGSIEFQGGNATFNPGTHFTGPGVAMVTSNALFNGAFDSSNLSLRSGTLTGAGAVLNGAANISGGTVSGTWTIAPGSTLDGLTGGNKFFNAVTLTNQGTLNWKTANSFFLMNNGRLINEGVFDIQADASMTFNGGAVGAFINTGLIQKNTGPGIFTIGNSLGFDNQGIVSVTSGTIRLPDNFTNKGTLKGSGAFATNTLTNSGHLAPGNSPGTLSLTGNLVQSATGTFDVELENILSSDLLLVSGNTTLSGTLALACFNNCTFAVGDEVVILDAAGQLGGTFSNMTMSGFGTGAFDVIYDLAADRVLLRATEPVTPPVPEPGTCMTMLIGLGLAGCRRRRR